MTFRNRLQYLLVWKLRISNKNALVEILKGNVFVNGFPQNQNIVVDKCDKVEWNGQVLKEPDKLLYIAFYKPKGIETTLNPKIKDGLKSILPVDEELYPVGRLDKASEGLLLLTNDGHMYNKVLRKEFSIEKEYLVTVDKVINEQFIEKMSSGIKIMGKITLPCSVEMLNDFMFKIILIQGLNRQIRRMCFQLGYDVLNLKRIRIGKLELRNLEIGEYKFLSSKYEIL